MTTSKSPTASTRLSARPFFLTIPIILIALLLSRSPCMMASTAPQQGETWADTPIKLVATPQFTTKKTDLFNTGATHMALLHNAILRGYNSIYQQAPHVQDVDRADFIGYALTWHKFVSTHHDDEEAVLFTQVEELLQDKTVWEASHREHEAFLQGLSEFHTYLTSLSAPTDFSGTKLRLIMASFEEAFGTHFHSEIATISALAIHPRAPAPGTPEEVKAAAVFKQWGKNTVTKAGMLDVVPFFLLNLDGTVEEGRWANWPPMPAPIKWGLTNIGGAFHSNWWKFSSCSGGKPRALYAHPSPVVED